MTSIDHHGKEQIQQDSCTGVATAFTIISIIILSLRTYARAAIVRNIGKDDWMMLLALLFTIGFLIAIYVLRANGMGYSGEALSLREMHTSIKTTLVIEIMYYLAVYSIKVSILFFYLRIAVEQNFERNVKVTIWVLTVFVVVCIIVCLTQCIPLHKMWDFTGLVTGHCINTTAFFYATSSFNIITDIWILALPMKTLLSIQRPKREKIALVFIFCLGVFSCIASIVRLHSIRIYTESKDPFYDSVPINLWSMIEINIGIWCASIPALKALFSSGQRDRSRQTAYASSKDKSGAHKLSSGRMGGSAIDGPHEVYNMGALQRPDPAPRKSNVESDRSGSQENIFMPPTVVYDKV